MKEFDKLEYIRTILEQLLIEIPCHQDKSFLCNACIDTEKVNQAIKYIDDLKFESEV